MNAPAVWRRTVRRKLLTLGYEESVFDPCLYYLKPTEEEMAGKKLFVAGIVLLDVDDFCQGGNARHQELMNQLRTQLKFGKWKDVFDSSADLRDSGEHEKIHPGEAPSCDPHQGAHEAEAGAPG